MAVFKLDAPMKRALNTTHKKATQYLLEDNPIEPEDPITKWHLKTVYSGGSADRTFNLLNDFDLNGGEKIVSFTFLATIGKADYDFSWESVSLFDTGTLEAGKGVLSGHLLDGSPRNWEIVGGDTIVFDEQPAQTTTKILGIISCIPVA